MSFDAKQSYVGRLFNNSLYRIPRNQRAYVWTDRNWTDLDKDLSLVVDHTAPSHFIGSIVLKSEDREGGLPLYTVIDGQQRIITCAVILAALVYTLWKKNMRPEATGTIKYLRAMDDNGEYHLVVSPEQHLSFDRLIKAVISLGTDSIDNTSITSFVRRCTVSKERDKQVLGAFSFFAKKFEGLNESDLVSYRDAVVSMQYVDISSSTDEDSYTIFEILNARGLELEDHELLKNYIMRYIHPRERRDDAKAIWAEIESTIGKGMKNFVRHYAIHYYRLGSGDKDSVYERIRDYTDAHDVTSLLYDLRQKADLYQSIQEPSMSDIDDTLRLLKSQKSTVFRPLLLSLMSQHSNGCISDDDYRAAMSFLKTFYVRYKVVGEMGSNHLTDAICKYAFAIEKQYKDGVLQEWMDSFTKKLPSENAMVASLRAMGWSNRWDAYKGTRCRDKCRLVLEILEEFAGGRIASADYTLEHILPDSADQDNAMVGNLLLLEEDLNRRCADKPLEDKLSIYSASRFVTTRRFAERYRNTSFDIDKRAMYMAKDLVKATTSTSS